MGIVSRGHYIFQRSSEEIYSCEKFIYLPVCRQPTLVSLLIQQGQSA
jgi:hypothetical protein